jgi:hypothetical protein
VNHAHTLSWPRTAVSLALSTLILASACENQPVNPGRQVTTGAAGSGSGPTTGAAGAAGSGASGAAGNGASTGGAGSPGAAGDGASAGSAGPTGAAGGSGGTTGAAGSGGTSGAAGSGGSSGAAGVTTGLAGAGGASPTGAAGTAAAGDTPPWRDMMPSDNMNHNVRFTAMQADPANAAAMDGASHPGSAQIAEVNATKPLKKKLCVVLPGIGNGPGQGIGDWAAGQGYHVFQVAYANSISEAANGDTNPDTPGNTRMNQFDGAGRTPSNANTKRFDSIEGRLIKGIQYLVDHDPGADWGWFLNKDGTMRWSDGCFIGYSYGASHLAVIARSVRIGLGVSVSGPQSEGHPDASWIKMPSATPVERLWAMWGSQDEPAPGTSGFASHYTTTTMLLGYLGDVVHTTTGGMLGTPPLMGSHRISVDGQGHTEFCAGMPPLYCNLMFALPPYDK